MMICAIPDCKGNIPKRMEGNNATCSPLHTKIMNRNNRKGLKREFYN